MMEKRKIRVAILDLYEKQANQGMRCLREILNQYGEENDLDLYWDEFEVRVEKQVPDLTYDIYISSGGPGSPLETEGSEWEKMYFNWLQEVETWNASTESRQKKYVFLICHSFQLVTRYYQLAQVCKRKSTSFGVFPIHLLDSGKNEEVFEGLRDPFYSVDSRDYQVVSPDLERMKNMGSSILAIEKDRPHVPLERAIMTIRFNDYMIGTQFHPEADPVGMSMYLKREDKKQVVIAEHGEAKWKSMIDHLNDPDKISLTYSHILPNFLDQSIEQLTYASA